MPLTSTRTGGPLTTATRPTGCDCVVYFVRPNCKNLDNWRRCRVHKLQWWSAWLHPKGRPPCVIDVQRMNPSQDGDDGCPDQVPFARPGPPPPVSEMGVLKSQETGGAEPARGFS